VLGVAATVLALGSAVLATLAGGRLGAAAFDPVEVPAGSLAVAVVGATLLGGCAVTLLSSPAAPSSADAETATASAAAEADDEPRAQPDNEAEPDSPPVSVPYSRNR
jgi:hypothetical protein